MYKYIHINYLIYSLFHDYFPFQNPTIFSGTIRENLDPSNEYNDEEIWSALERARLKRFVCRSGKGLEVCLTDTGGRPSLVFRFVFMIRKSSVF